MAAKTADVKMKINVNDLTPPEKKDSYIIDKMYLVSGVSFMSNI